MFGIKLMQELQPVLQLWQFAAKSNRLWKNNNEDFANYQSKLWWFESTIFMDYLRTQWLVQHAFRTAKTSKCYFYLIQAEPSYSPLKCKGLRNFLPSQLQNDNFEFITAHKGDDPILAENQLVKFEKVVMPSKAIDNGQFRAPTQGVYRFEIQVEYGSRNCLWCQ